MCHKWFGTLSTRLKSFDDSVSGLNSARAAAGAVAVGVGSREESRATLTVGGHHRSARACCGLSANRDEYLLVGTPGVAGEVSVPDQDSGRPPG